MTRRVQPEWLDHLPPEDVRARASRRDLRRLNRWMGNARFLGQALARAGRSTPPTALLDLGSGDGDATLRVLQHLPIPRDPRPLLLLDRQPVVSHVTLTAMRQQGWQPTVVADDVFDWLARQRDPPPPVVMANLFLHHFEEDRLRELLGRVATRGCRLVACEPRRSPLSRVGARLVGLIGCNAVTRHDARVSVDAGFRDGELSALWPDHADWRLIDRRAGWFCQLFVAEPRGTCPE